MPNVSPHEKRTCWRLVANGEHSRHQGHVSATAEANRRGQRRREEPLPKQMLLKFNSKPAARVQRCGYVFSIRIRNVLSHISLPIYVHTNGQRCLPPFNIKNSLSTTWPESVKLRRLQRLNWFGPSRMSLGIGLGMANGWVRAHWISGLGHRMPHWLLDIINNQFYRFSTAYILRWNICL